MTSYPDNCHSHSFCRENPKIYLFGWHQKFHWNYLSDFRLCEYLNWLLHQQPNLYESEYSFREFLVDWSNKTPRKALLTECTVLSTWIVLERHIATDRHVRLLWNSLFCLVTLNKQSCTSTRSYTAKGCTDNFCFLKQGCANSERQIICQMIFVCCRLMFVCPQQETCFVSVFCYLEFWCAC
jgi:hypothetical protein